MLYSTCVSDFICGQSCPSLAPWTVPHQTPLSMEFSRQEYWRGLPFSTPGDLTDPRMEPVYLVSPALAGIFVKAEPPGKPWWVESGPKPKSGLQN